MKIRRILMIGLLGSALLGCGGEQTPYAPFVQTGSSANFTLGGGGTQTVAPGGTASYTITVTAAGGTTQALKPKVSDPVSLSVSGNPANTTPSFAPTKVDLGGQSTLTVATAANTPLGTTTLTVTGSNSTGSATTTVTLIVSAPPNFTIDIAPSDQGFNNGNPGGASVHRGIAQVFVDYTITVTPVNGFQGTVNLSEAGLDNVTDGELAILQTTLNPTSVSLAGGVKTANLRVTRIRTSSVVGVFPFTVTGSSGGVTKTANAELSINQGLP